MTYDPPASPPSTPGPLGSTGAAKTSVAAILSLVLGIAGFVTAGVTGIVGLICGIMALVNISKSEGRLGGKGLAIGGVVLSSVSMLGLCLIAGLLLPALGQARGTAQRLKEQTQLRQLMMATATYDAEHDALPPVATWDQALIGDAYIGPDLLESTRPSAGSGRAFAMNAALSGLTLEEADPACVLFFECDPGGPASGGSELLPAQPRHRGGYLVVYCDGTVDIVPDASVLVWEP